MSQEKHWDELYLKGNTWKKETLDLPKIFKNKNVLELGVGNGKTLRSIIRQKPWKITAIDISKVSLDIVRKEFRDHPTELLNCSVCKLPFDDESFDIVVCFYVMNNLSPSEREKASSEIYRVLGKDGKLVFEDFSKGDFRNKNHDDIVKKDGIYCHFFDIKELDTLFSKFSKNGLDKKKSIPIHKRNDLKREVIKGILVK